MKNAKKFAILCSVILLCLATTAVFAQTEIFEPEEPAVEPHVHNSSCYITVSGVVGDYVERWYGSPIPSGVITGEFIPYSTSDITDIVYDGHDHIGTLTQYHSVDPGNTIPSVQPDGGNYYKRVYSNATATYYGSLTCDY